ncbi:MAG: cell division protein FtsL [Elusimicrobiota bacterium]|jgi:cell division protein FtsL|nr:cell division protein FtsL [Elusimicrobiota bacterium]
MSFKKKIWILFILLLFIIFLILNIWEKYFVNYLNYQIQDLLKNINNLEEHRNDFILEKGKLEDLKRIKDIAINKLGMKKIDEKDMVILKKG